MGAVAACIKLSPPFVFHILPHFKKKIFFFKKSTQIKQAVRKILPPVFAFHFLILF